MNRFLTLGGKILVALIVTIVAVGLLLTWFDAVILSTYLSTAGFIVGPLVAILPPLLVIGALVALYVALFKRVR